MAAHIWKLPLKNRGFTMAELLIVVSIITILTVIGLNSFNRQGQRARDSRRIADLEQIRSALEMYRLSQPDRTYPSTLNELVNDRFMPAVPRDPFTNGGLQYSYVPANSDTEYTLCSHMEVATTGPACAAGGHSCGSETCNFQMTQP